MSSVDLHTHCGYQLMLAEAVAVVYAPGDNRKRCVLNHQRFVFLLIRCGCRGFARFFTDFSSRDVMFGVDEHTIASRLNIVGLLAIDALQKCRCHPMFTPLMAMKAST